MSRLSYEKTISEYLSFIHSIVAQKIALPQDQEDVESEIRLSLLIALPRFDRRSNLRTFIRSIVEHRIMDYFRAKYREKKKIEEIKTLIVEMTIPDDDTFRRIRNVVKSATMTDRQKTVFRMIGRGMNNQEIASALHLSIDTVRSHVKAINRRLRTSNRVKIALTAHKIFHD